VGGDWREEEIQYFGSRLKTLGGLEERGSPRQWSFLCFLWIWKFERVETSWSWLARARSTEATPCFVAPRAN
jgi:hypothetical protein